MIGHSLVRVGGNVPSGSISSTEIENGSIVNADVNASAAIAGTKISPVFSNQAVTITIPDAGNKVGLTVTNSDNTNDPDAVSLVQDTTAGSALYITNAGNVAYAGENLKGLVTIKAFNATDTGDLLKIWVQGAQKGIHIWLDKGTTEQGIVVKDSSAGDNMISEIGNGRTNAVGSNRFYRNLAAANTAGPVVFIHNDNASDDQSSLILTHDHTNAAAIRLNGATGVSTKNPESDAEVGFLKINVDGTDQYVPYYAAS